MAAERGVCIVVPGSKRVSIVWVQIFVGEDCLLVYWLLLHLCVVFLDSFCGAIPLNRTLRLILCFLPLDDMVFPDSVCGGGGGSWFVNWYRRGQHRKLFGHMRRWSLCCCTPPYLIILTQQINRDGDKVPASSDHLYIKYMKFEPISLSSF